MYYIFMKKSDEIASKPLSKSASCRAFTLKEALAFKSLGKAQMEYKCCINNFPHFLWQLKFINRTKNIDTLIMSNSLEVLKIWNTKF